MKLYKIDFDNRIGNNVVTVPTDSEFLLGLSNGDSASIIRLYDGETEFIPLEDKIGNYTCFRFETGSVQFRKVLKGTVNGKQPVEILVICKKMSVAYRDLEGLTSGATCNPLVKITPTEDVSVTIDATNFMDVERTVYEIGSGDMGVTPVGITIAVDDSEFSNEGEEANPIWKTSLLIKCVGDIVANPSDYISITIGEGESATVLTTDDIFAYYVTGPASLSTIISDSSGIAILVEVLFGLDGGYASIKGASYI